MNQMFFANPLYLCHYKDEVCRVVCTLYVCELDRDSHRVSFVSYRFAVATPEELAVNNDDCAICWDSMQAARKLPCGHLFHK